MKSIKYDQHFTIYNLPVVFITSNNSKVRFDNVWIFNSLCPAKLSPVFFKCPMNKKSLACSRLKNEIIKNDNQ